MEKSNYKFLVTLCFLMVFLLAYCATFWFEIRLPRFYPLENSWRLSHQADAPSQAWYGKTGFAFTLSILFALLMIFFSKIIPHATQQINKHHVQICGSITILVLLGGLAYILTHEFLRWNVF